MKNLEKLKETLEQKGYTVSLFKTAAEATDFLVEEAREKSVGIGGSKTVEEMGLYPKLQEVSTVHFHWEGGSIDEANRAQIYLSSVNGVAETGELINIDGKGNRVSATIFGTETVYFIIGVNKVAPTFDQAMWRARNIAAPKNAQRLGVKTPCSAKADRCYDCNAPQRICCSQVVYMRPPFGGNSHVVLVNENLGY